MASNDPVIIRIQATNEVGPAVQGATQSLDGLAQKAQQLATAQAGADAQRRPSSNTSRLSPRLCGPQIPACRAWAPHSSKRWA